MIEGEVWSPKTDVPCPYGCDQGWISDGRCSGRMCGWEGHYEENDGRDHGR